MGNLSEALLRRFTKLAVSPTRQPLPLLQVHMPSFNDPQFGGGGQLSHPPLAKHQGAIHYQEALREGWQVQGIKERKNIRVQLQRQGEVQTRANGGVPYGRLINTVTIVKGMMTHH